MLGHTFFDDEFGCGAVVALGVIAVASAVGYAVLQATNNLWLSIVAGLAAPVGLWVAWIRGVPILGALAMSAIPAGIAAIIAYLIVHDWYLAGAVAGVVALLTVIAVVRLVNRNQRAMPPPIGSPQSSLASPPSVPHAGSKHEKPPTEFSGPF